MDVVTIYKSLEELSDGDLDLIYQRCQHIRSTRVKVLRVGEKVFWHDKHKHEYSGVVKKVNIKTVTLVDTDHPRFTRGVRVPLSWVRPA